MTILNYMDPKDASIIAIICRFPGMSRQEIDGLLDKLEDQSHRKVGLALAGYLDEEELTPDELLAMHERREANTEKTARIHRQEIESRRQGKISLLARNLLRLYENGQISQNMLLIYGVQGSIPERHGQSELSHEQRVDRLRNRMNQRFGNDWEYKVGNLPPWLRYQKEWRVTKVQWCKDGF